jgi:hypothetical protein
MGPHTAVGNVQGKAVGMNIQQLTERLYAATGSGRLFQLNGIAIAKASLRVGPA